MVQQCPLIFLAAAIRISYGLLPLHLTTLLSTLCQGTSTTASGALHGSANVSLSQGLPAAALGAEASMAGSALTADVSELSMGQVESSMAAVSLLPEASGLSGPGVSALQGRLNLNHLP